MQIIAHRGASGLYPENTLLAIEQALLANADGIEIDVFCVENTLVVIHDENVNRTTNGTGLLQDFTLKQLQQLDAGSGQQVPTLWQVLQLVNNQTLLNIELKGADTIEPLLQLLAKAETELGTDPDKLLISSFNHHLLKKIKTQKPNLKLGALTASLPLDYAVFASELGAWSVNCDKGFINQHMVLDAHQRGLKVWVYTVNDAVTAAKMQQLGVDAIFCNYPQEARGW
ncbi:glycerophosphodiester phosphodiesterase [Rheinheimera sediminis]|uniref:glycerophosphodiester phosphodiesterase n=1 Tax=Rheinheimera sp. YQF-1 TaxID=2499626 RepID=UPI000FD7A011|nr:glycerophosphodiester phosphodiesterase family protein [Rheinheimera sp. YQF-1]RVT47876.1 glycerophosphodiester phosphodiesterase [Rheinheimera sp. YQF-1]